MPKKFNLAGQTFGRLEVIGQKLISDGRKTFWHCRCVCGIVRLVGTQQLTSGKTQSCGCMHREMLIQRSYKHGETGSHEYIVWQGMRQRCNNPRAKSYRLYGARGIRICERWQQSFAAFLTDMGRAPSPKHSLDRMNNEQGYSPENCQWATNMVQCRNKRNNHTVTHDGRTMCLSAWAEETTIPYSALKRRLVRYQWTVERALTTPVRPVRMPK